MDGRGLVAWNVRRLRVERALSQEQLAVDAGIDRTYIGGIERGVENPTVGVLDRLAGALSIHISELFLTPPKRSERPKALPGGRKPKAN